MRRKEALAVVALIVTNIAWAGNFLLGKVAVGTMDPLSLVFLRWSLVVIPLLVVAQCLEHPDWRSALRHWPRLLLLGLLGIIGYTLLLYWALQHTTPLNAALVNAFNPALIVLAAVVFLHAKIGWKSVAGIITALIGVIFLLTDGRVWEVFSVHYGLGDLLIVIAVVLWTAYTIIARRSPVPPITSTALQVLFSVVLLVPFVILFGLHLPSTPAGAWSLIYIAVFPSLIAYVLWNWALSVVGPSQAAVYLNLLPMLTAAASVLMGVSLTWGQIVGGVLVIAGVVLTNERARPRPHAASAEAVPPSTR